VTIRGAGAGSAIIQAGTSSPVSPSTCSDCIDRVFDILGSIRASFDGVTIRHGLTSVGGGGAQ